MLEINRLKLLGFFNFIFHKKHKSNRTLYDDKNKELTHESLIAKQPRKRLIIFSHWHRTPDV